MYGRPCECHNQMIETRGRDNPSELNSQTNNMQSRFSRVTRRFYHMQGVKLVRLGIVCCFVWVVSLIVLVVVVFALFFVVVVFLIGGWGCFLGWGYGDFPVVVFKTL